ncbi:hypothetical protein DPMN_161618 [Dreissena polymorpha]|uniref:G-protein coupled receptors family 1 profile domain-containing protein n=1 Tax=Dreissena polymorpha TaxID=45954 RepID=A0A9D4ETD0_DREPO|nr:hypothetical protein DPMN_161618 [Dreissena polymorpha]
MTMLNTTRRWSDGILDRYSEAYSMVHGYVSLVICAIGIPLNLLNIVVLTRKNMQTPINCMLTWLAVFDMATMVSYVPFAVHFYCEYPANSISPQKNSWAWMNFLLVYLNVSATAHTISIWLAVAMAIFRHSYIHSPAQGTITRIRRLIRARIVVGVVVLASILVMIPNYLSHKLIEYQRGSGEVMYVFERSNIGSGNEEPIILAQLLLYSILAKLVPCLLIIIFGTLLLVTLNTSRIQNTGTAANGTPLRPSSRGRQKSRTTTMLLMVFVLFLITELPQGILILGCIVKQHFFEKVYIPLGDTMDIIALVNSGINFVLYCSMSQEFRNTFISLFCRMKGGPNGRGSYVSSHVRNDQLQVTLTHVPTLLD